MISGGTIKCRICGAPYKWASMTVADQSACPACVAEAERRVFEPTEWQRAEQARRRRRHFDGRVRSGFIDGAGRDATQGDEVEYCFGQRRGILGEVMPDGDADVTWLDDGSYGCVKWGNLCRVPDEHKKPR